MRDEFRIHARIQRLKSFSELRSLAIVLDGSKAIISDKAVMSTSGPPKIKWLDKRKMRKLRNPKCRIRSNNYLREQEAGYVVVMTTGNLNVQKE